MSLLDECACLAQIFGHFEADHDNGESASAKGRGAEFLGLNETLLGRDNPHIVQLLEKIIRDFDAGLVARVQLAEDARELRDKPDYLVVLLVIVTILDMIATHYLQDILSARI